MSTGSVLAMHPWRQAMQQALYGPRGFFTTGAGAKAHFRTSVHAAPEFAQAIARLAVDLDEQLGDETFQIVDVGAGDGELLTQLDVYLPTAIRSRIELIAVELRPRPSTITNSIAWSTEIPDEVVGLIIANEWLDNVPLDVCEKTADADLVYVLVDDEGREQLGAPIDDDARAWLASWWPQDDVAAGDRAEIGTTRDRAWHAALTKLVRGMAIAIDYGHQLGDRSTGRFSGGTMRGFRAGHVVAPLPDGSCDITADVAIDACAAAGASLAAVTIVTNQREALAALGVSGSRPPVDLAHTDPSAYIAQLSAASRAGELTNTGQLGGYYWLIQTRNVDLPASLLSLSGLG